MVLQRKLHFWNLEHFVPLCPVHTFSSGILILIAYYMILSTLLTIYNFTNSSAAAKKCKKAQTQMKHEQCHIKKIRAENVYHKTMLQNKNKSSSSVFEIL